MKYHSIIVYYQDDTSLINVKVSFTSSNCSFPSFTFTGFSYGLCGWTISGVQSLANLYLFKMNIIVILGISLDGIDSCQIIILKIYDILIK